MKTRKITKYEMKLANKYLTAVNYGRWESVRTAYKSPSIYKIQAEQRIYDEMKSIDINSNDLYETVNYTLLSNNCHSFSAGYSVIERATGNLVAVVYHTRYNRYIIPIGGLGRLFIERDLL